jgi:hypothetical protein
MKRKKMILAILVPVGVVLGYGFYKAQGLKNIQIVKEVTVQGSPQEVFDMVKYLNNFPKWSPFLAEDPSQKVEVKGTDGTVGAQYHWAGNKGKDLGYQEIVGIENEKMVKMKCNIQKPFVATPTFDYYFTKTTNGVVVKQDFRVESSLSAAFFMWIFGAKSGMEKTNEKGLELLKLAVEKGK